MIAAATKPKAKTESRPTTNIFELTLFFNLGAGRNYLNQSNIFHKCFADRGLKPRPATLVKRMTPMRHQGFIIAKVLAEHLRNHYSSVPKSLSRDLSRNQITARPRRRDSLIPRHSSPGQSPEVFRRANKTNSLFI